jgi:hypothetical protein
MSWIVVRKVGKGGRESWVRVRRGRRKEGYREAGKRGRQREAGGRQGRQREAEGGRGREKKVTLSAHIFSHVDT